ncbi:MAG TPA: FecR domain-containing protein [Caulobacteraceae bacterium]
METADRIEAAAARWLARHEAGPLSEADARAFEAWCAGDPRRLGAYVRLEAVSARLGRAGALSGMPMKPPARRRRFIPAAIAAALAIAVLPAASAIKDYATAQRFSTDIGQQYRAALADGSLVELNTATKVAVALKPDQRDIRLTRGEAVFEVAKDKARPFVVKTPLADVRAVGTVFSVRSDDGLEVSVSEGVVAVERGGKVLAHVSAGETFSMTRSGEVRQTGGQIDVIQREMAWREGKVAFAGETLAQAAAEINRYNRRQVKIADPQISDLRVGGYFRATDPEGFAAAIAGSFPVTAEAADDVIILRARAPA